MSVRPSRRLLRTSAADALRARVRKGIDLCAFVCATIGVLIEIVHLVQQPTLIGLLAMLVMAAIGVVGLLGLTGRISWSPVAFVALVIVANITYLLWFGPWVGLGAVYILALAVSLLFGSPRRARIIALVLIATPLTIGLLAHIGVVGAIALDLRDTSSWARATLATITALIGISLISHFTVRQLVLERRAIENLLARERAERLERDRVADELARARRADAIAQLAAEVGADIGAALAIIRQRANLLAAELQTADARDSLGDIVEAASNAGSTMRQLTAFAPTATTEHDQGDATAAVRALHKLVHRVLPPTVTLEVTTVDDVLVPIGTSDLTRICANLVLNARDAIEATGTIWVSLARDTTHATIRVRDNGTGMTDHTLANLFQPFFTTKPVGRGTGLGLATTKILVERAQGTISVESALGVGTTFTIRLPLLPLPAA